MGLWKEDWSCPPWAQGTPPSPTCGKAGSAPACSNQRQRGMGLDWKTCTPAAGSVARGTWILGLVIAWVEALPNGSQWWWKIDVPCGAVFFIFYLFIPSSSMWQQRGASKQGRAEALEGEKVCTPHPTNFGNQPQCKSVLTILAKTRIPPKIPFPWGKGKQLQKGAFKVWVPKQTQPLGYGGSTHWSNWDSTLPDFSQIVQGQAGTLTHIDLHQRTSQEVQDWHQWARINNIRAKSTKLHK